MPDLQQDVAQRQKEDSTRLVPKVGATPAGYVLTVVGVDPPEYAWHQIRGATNPATHAFLEAFLDPDGGFTTNTLHDIDWIVNAAATTGAGIIINGSGNIEITTAGVYAVNATFGAEADTAADTYSEYRGFLDIGRPAGASPNRDSIILTDIKQPAVRVADNKHYGWSGLTYVGYLPVATIIKVSMQMVGGGAVTWSSDGGNIQLDRIG